jgi:hypothetical protein
VLLVQLVIAELLVVLAQQVQQEQMVIQVLKDLLVQLAQQDLLV